MSNPGHSRSEASKDPYDGVSWMKNRGRKKKAVVTGVVNKPPVKPANPVPAPPPQPSPPPDTPSDVSYQSDTASDTELSPFPSPSQTPTQRHPTPSTSAASKPPANDTSVFVSNLPASITQKSFFSALTSTFPSLRTAEVSVFSQERRAMLRIPAAYGSLFESAEEIKKLSHRLGEPCAALVRRSTARPATTNRPSLSSFSVVVRGVDRTTTEADIKEALGFAGLRCIRVMRITARRTGQPTTLMRVITRDADTAQRLLHDGLIAFGPASESLVTKDDLLRLLSLLVANLHPQERAEVANILDNAARDVLGYSVKTVYSWNQQLAAVQKIDGTPHRLSKGHQDNAFQTPLDFCCNINTHQHHVHGGLRGVLPVSLTSRTNVRPKAIPEEKSSSKICMTMLLQAHKHM
ncbi:uncharacterized protein LOC124163374 [Ischnura elegans]|uniref:uncharacterized protein LOC124163374 n=3 Tax=Ischnura elegans TaxID=197161 RepID=UPI001ED8B8A5|nr:uncharacterized protein LOC124163374 [Ischnura elegans]